MGLWLLHSYLPYIRLLDGSPRWTLRWNLLRKAESRSQGRLVAAMMKHDGSFCRSLNISSMALVIRLPKLASVLWRRRAKPSTSSKKMIDGTYFIADLVTSLIILPYVSIDRVSKKTKRIPKQRSNGICRLLCQRGMPTYFSVSPT